MLPLLSTGLTIESGEKQYGWLFKSKVTGLWMLNVGSKTLTHADIKAINKKLDELNGVKI